MALVRHSLNCLTISPRALSYSVLRETLLQSRVLAVLNHRESPCRLWRNNVGTYCPDPVNRPQVRIAYGLGVGSADLVGLVITNPAIFLAVEIKTPVGRLSKEQKAWGATIEKLGGIYRVIRSVEEAEKFVEWLRNNVVHNRINGAGALAS